MDESKAPGVHGDEERLCAVCGDEVEGKYFRVSHLLSAHKLAVCEECFDGRKTWMDLRGEYFGDYAGHYKEMEEEVRQGYENGKAIDRGGEPVAGTPLPVRSSEAST
jgi:hypothetical protein